MKLKDFSATVEGIIIGDPDIDITGVSGVKDAKKGDITFVSSPKFLKYAHGSEASCIIVKEAIEGMNITQLKVSNPYYAFARALEYFYPAPSFKPVISSAAEISPKAMLGKDVSILPLSYVSDGVSIGEKTVVCPGVFIGENTKIGCQCIIYPNVTIRENILIGDRVIIHSGSVIGSDGFGYVFEKGAHYKIPQAGGVIIEDDVEIGSNCSIDRATINNTVIRRGTKIDNLVQIAHNVTIGEKSLIVAQVGIGGSSEIGDFVTIGGQTAIADHAAIDSGTMIVGQSGLAGRVTRGIYAGSPAIPHKTWLRAQALYGKLPEMNKKLRELEERLTKFEKGNAGQ